MLDRKRAKGNFKVFSVVVAVAMILACQGTVTPDLDNPSDPSDDPPPEETPSVPVSADAGGPYAALRETPLITFDGGETSDPEGNIVDYLWDFGDGTTGDGEVVEHAYEGTIAEYTVTLTLRGTGSVELDSDTTAARIRERPVGSFEVITAAEEIVVGGQVEFDASASNDGDGLGFVGEYRWDFEYDGDFSPSKSASEPIARHTWTAGEFPREVTVALMVVDDDGFESSSVTSRDITVNDAEGVMVKVK